MKVGIRSTALLASLLIAFCAGRATALDVPGSQSSSTTTQGALVDDADAGWTWSGFVEYDDPQLHGGTAHAGGPDSYAVYTFTGTGVDVYVMDGPQIAIDGRGHRLGRMQVSIDGHVKGDAPTQKPAFDYNVDGFSVTGLSSGVHVLKIDPQDGWVAVDYIRVQSGSEDTPQGTSSTDSSSGKTAGNGVVNIPEGDYRIYPLISQSSDLDAKDRKTSDGTVVQIWKAGDHQNNQWFHITPMGNGQYWFAPLSAKTEAVTMLTPNTDNTIPAGLWQYTNNPAQIWVITATPDGWCRISPSNAPSLALTVQSGATIDGTLVICDTWNGLRQQEWAIGIQ